MEDPTNTGIVSAAPATTSLHTFLRRPSKKALLFASIALAVFVYIVVLVCNFSLVVFAITNQGTRFETVENGVPTWYAVSFGMAKRVEGPAGYEKAPVTVLESIVYDTSSGKKAVLAHVPGGEGIALGILYSNNTFENVLSDGTSKSNLSVRPDGVALYASMVDGESHIMQLDMTKSGSLPRDLGRGRSPRLFSDGFFTAITDKGIVRIDPVSGTTVLIPSRDADLLHGTLSLDGATAVISNTSNKTLFYTIEKTSPSTVSLIGTLPQILEAPVSFVSGAYILEPSARGVGVYTFGHSAPKRIGTLFVK